MIETHVPNLGTSLNSFSLFTILVLCLNWAEIGVEYVNGMDFVLGKTRIHKHTNTNIHNGRFFVRDVKA